MSNYIHGYIPEEQDRLLDQAGVLGPMIYPWVDFSDKHHVLEVGSGVGAQSQVLLSLYPQIDLTCVEIEEKQIEKAKSNLSAFWDRNIQFLNQDASKMNLERKADGAFICWVLEHLSEPSLMLEQVFDNMESTGTIFVTEVFNSSFQFIPKLPGLSDYYKAYNHFQEELGGNPDVGLILGNLLQKAGFKDIELRRSGFHLDQTNPEELKKIAIYWKGLMKSGAEAMLKNGKVSIETVRQMEIDLDQIAEHPEGVLFYQFVQAKANKP